MQEPFDSFDEFDEPKKAIVSTDKPITTTIVEIEQTKQEDKKEKTSIPKSKKNK